MPDIPTNSNLDPKQAPKIDSGPRKNLGKPPAAPDWRSMWWYIPVMLLILWAWQDQLHQMSVKTIPYSQFKQYLAAGEVAECEVKELEITGRVVPKEARSAAAPTAGKSDELKPLALPGKSSLPAPSGKSPSGPAEKPAPAAIADSSKPKEEKPKGEAAKIGEGGSGQQPASKDATEKQAEAKPFPVPHGTRRTGLAIGRSTRSGQDHLQRCPSQLPLPVPVCLGVADRRDGPDMGLPVARAAHGRSIGNEFRQESGAAGGRPRHGRHLRRCRRLRRGQVRTPGGRRFSRRIPTVTSLWAPGFPRACCSSDCPARGRRCWPARSPARPRFRSSR